MDYDALKEQWGEVEDRDGVRLSWNVFPSTRMVSCRPAATTSRPRKLMRL
jgi:protein transport protein SEC23